MSGTAGHTPWLNLIPRRNYRSAEARLEDEIWAYVDYMTPSPEEEIVIHFVGKLVQGTLRPVFPGCKVHVSGSTASGLRLPRSDIDLVIETLDEVSAVDGLIELADLMTQKGWVEGVDEILDARVPIIRISTTPEFGSLNFDVGINSTAGLRNNEWVRTRINTMPALKPLALIIRGALSQRGLNDASQHGLSSFAVVCMCVFFLQYNPYQLRRSQLVNPRWTKSLVEILKGFLMYYSRDVPFERWYISASRGRLVKKPKKGYGRLIHRRCYENLVIQCPTDPARNITASLSVEKFQQIQYVFGRALERIQNAETTSRNVLGPLVSVDYGFMEYRREIRQLVRSGQLSGNIEYYESELETEDESSEDMWN